jgi:hypothetical protein
MGVRLPKRGSRSIHDAVRRVLLILCLLLAPMLAAPAWAARITAIESQPGRVIVTADGPLPAAQAFALAQPFRLVVDFVGVVDPLTAPGTYMLKLRARDAAGRVLDHLEADSSDSSSGPSDDEPSDDDDFTKPAPPPPLPKGWLARIATDGQRFFENLLTGETSWDAPTAETAPPGHHVPEAAASAPAAPAAAAPASAASK